MNCLKLHPQDTVALAIKELKKGETVEIDGETISILENIPNAHKIALKDFTEGEAIKKYGNTIGYASCHIKKGTWIHEHNEISGLKHSHEYVYNFNPETTILPGVSEDTFMGYLRNDGTAGIRNYLAIIPTVSCANGPLKKLAQEKIGRASCRERV